MFETIFGEARVAHTVIARSACDEAIQLSLRRHGLLPGACHRAALAPTRWLAMTGLMPMPGAFSLIATMRRLNESPVPGRADQDLIDADPWRHAGDEGDGAAEVFGLQHARLLLFARHHRPQLQDRRRHLAWRKTTRAQTVDAFVHVERMGQLQHRMFGGCVGRARHLRDMAAGPGRNVDDAAVLLLAHRRQHRAHAVQDAVEIDIDELVPAFELHVGPAALWNIDAGVVDQEVDTAMTANNLLRRSVHVRGFADVQRHRLALAATACNLRHHGVQRILAAPRNHHRPAVRGQRFRPGLADAAAAAGDPGYAFSII